jgi:two-component system, NtrC family, sensor kinase
MLILTILKGPDQGKRFELPDDEPQLIGRSSEALPLTDRTISRRHAELTPDDGRWYINDIHSGNGTFVNGRRVIERRLLQPGDQIRTGNTLVMYGRDATKKRRGVKIAKKNEMDVSIEKAIPSNDDSMIMAVQDPTEEAGMHLKVIYELTQLIGSTVNREVLLERVMDVIFEYFRADRGFILITDQMGERPDPAVVRHRVKPRKRRGEEASITVSKTIVQHVMQQGEGVLSSNAMADERFSSHDSVHEFGIRSAICVPIKFKEEMFGVIHVDSKINNFTYTEDQLLLLNAIGVQTGLALANMDEYEKRIRDERLAAVGQTVASLSHSIKNIIQGLRGGAEVVELGFRKKNMETVKGGWEICARNLERISGLTLNMLAFSKRRKPELSMVNLRNTLEDVLALMERQFDNKKVAVITEIDQDMPPVPVDASGMEQALLNLLNNALEAVPKEVGAVTIRTEYDDKANIVRLAISDNGEGMSSAVTSNLFQPFHSTKGLKGTGLGLVVTKKIVEEHAGKIEVKSAPGDGTTFTVTLPLNPADIMSNDTITSASGEPASPFESDNDSGMKFDLDVHSK